MNTFNHKLGEVVHWLEKVICGCFCVGIIMFFLIGPFLLFSNLALIASSNLVIGGTAAFNLQMTNTSSGETFKFPLYTTTSPLSINTMSEDEFNSLSYDTNVDTKFFTSD